MTCIVCGSECRKGRKTCSQECLTTTYRHGANHSPYASHKKLSPKPARKVLCSHHWVIDTPAGTYSDARCKKCKATRQFCNVSETDMPGPDAFQKAQRMFKG